MNYSVHEHITLKRVSAMAASPDGSWLAVEFKPDEDAEQRMQVWVLPAGGGEPQQLTDEPLGVEAFQFAKNAARLVLLAPVLPHIAHDKQRETVADALAPWGSGPQAMPPAASGAWSGPPRQ